LSAPLRSRQRRPANASQATEPTRNARKTHRTLPFAHLPLYPLTMGRVKQMANKANPELFKMSMNKGKVKVTASQIEKDKRLSMIRSRQSKRAYALRTVAKAAGYLPYFGIQADGAAGRDSEFCLLSIHDAKRLIRFDITSEKTSENEERAVVLKEALPPKALRHAQIRLNALFSSIMNDAFLRIVDNQKRKLTAKDMYAAIRQYVHKGRFSQARTAAAIVRVKLQEENKLPSHACKFTKPKYKGAATGKAAAPKTEGTANMETDDQHDKEEKEAEY
jgi:hypothetical protein